MVLNFRDQLQCRMGGKREDPIEVYPKFWNLEPATKDTKEVLRIPAGTKNFEFLKRELETKLERDVLPAATPELPTVRQMTQGMNSPMVVPSLHARATVEPNRRCSRTAGTPCSSGNRQRYISIPVKPRYFRELHKQRRCGIRCLQSKRFEKC